MSHSKDIGTDATPIPTTIDLNLSNNEGLRELVKKRLAECGWESNLKTTIRNMLQESQGGVTHDQLIASIRPTAREAVPEHIRSELLQDVRNAMGGNLPPKK